MGRRCLAGLLVLLLFASSCAPRQHFETQAVPEATLQSYLADKSPRLSPAYRRLLEEGKRNQALNLMRLGLDALQLGLTEEATRAFSEVTQIIDAIYADDPEAAKARSLWYEEGQKDFKGEPYERAMAYYYLGLIDAWHGDLENARASFKSGILQDAFAEEDQNRCDFASLIYLAGWVSRKNGDEELARTAFEEVRQLRGELAPPDSGNSLLLIETGTAPRKVADGPGHSELKFRRGRHFQENAVFVSIDGGDYTPAYLLEDLYWQSTSRGGRPVDKIVKGKAQFRNTNAEIGGDLGSVSDHLLIAGAALSSTPGLTYAGAALGLVSVTQIALAARSRTYADVRYWDNLPDKIHVLPMDLPPGSHSLSIIFTDSNGQHLADLDHTLKLEAGKGGAPLTWVTSRQRLSTSP
ncbi:hypothetical protein JCM30471_30200 [Desulfuromonas carbonis]|uniref:hypothetical protein n=1 Tax=Desulfuromonas sp. DDH964 TaxID=1823759 RepID=UPI00078D6815|nr:hypothetical protein [Desulfuromonas sp. DDH964]AMV71182.1 hypothetical protein DBW_0799 [Desulfuromonas sp. DDH964]